MPFPANPTDLQVYSTNGNFFIFKTGKGWSRIEGEIFFKQGTEPTANDVKGRKAIWQDTANSILYFWDNSSNKWITPKQDCGLYVPRTPKFLRFYSSSKEKIIESTLPISESKSAFYVAQQERIAISDAVNSRIPSDYNIEVINPVSSSSDETQTITYFVQILDSYNKPMTFLEIPKFSAKWHSSNTVTNINLMLNVLSVEKAEFNDSVHVIKVKVPKFLTSTSTPMVNYNPDRSFNVPTTFNIELTATEYNISIVNVIPSAHFEYWPNPLKEFPDYPNNGIGAVPAHVNVVIYPQSHQLQNNGIQFNIPIIVEAISGYSNIYDFGGNYTGFQNMLPADGKKNTTYTNSANTGTFSIEVTGIYNTNGTPVATLTGTKTKNMSDNGLIIFDDLILTVTGHTLDLTKIPIAKLTVSTSSGQFKSRDIFIYWI